VTIDRLRLVRYKGFESYTVSFRNPSLLVGPNNAGKSTIIAAMRVCAHLIVHAKRQKAENPYYDAGRDRRVRGYPLNLTRLQFSDENVRHEFREEEARLELRFKNKAALYVVWPVDDDPFFYVEHIDGMQPSNVRITKEYYGSIGVVPTLSPVEQTELPLSADHVRSHLSSRLVSRHFRNQLKLLRAEGREEFDRACEFILDNTPEMDSLELVAGQSLDLFFRESGGRVEREICWAGDGIQIWLQVLFHVWRQRDLTTLILDEPDVFLHPDLQRRLVRVLEDCTAQVILATHAPEMLSEASRDAVVIIDRTRKRSRSIANEKVLADLNHILGSGFNLKLARALRSRVALFVEGNDMKVLKNFASAIRADGFAREKSLTVAPMQGASNHQLASSFGWLNVHLLDNAVQVAVLLDRDYLSDEMVHDLRVKIEEAGVSCHIWRRKELESYLLIPSLIARCSGATEAEVDSIISGEVDELYPVVLARYLDVRSQAERRADRHAVSVNEHHLKMFAEMWKDSEWARNACPAKDVLSGVNGTLQDRGYKAVSPRGLSARIRAHEVPAEMRDVILDIEAKLVAPISES